MRQIRESASSGEVRAGTVFRASRTFTRKDVETFGRLTLDYNPVHYEPRWAALKGHQGLICHGLLVGSLICQIGGQLGWLASGMSFRFRKPVYIGDTVTCEMTIIKVDDQGRASAECVFYNQQDELVLSGELYGYLPDAGARELLAAMIEEGDPTNEL
jgi:3-hydroxybutyryl-CoA dehydratase